MGNWVTQVAMVSMTLSFMALSVTGSVRILVQFCRTHETRVAETVPVHEGQCHDAEQGDEREDGEERHGGRS